MTRAGELDQAAVVDDAVDHRRRHLVVPQDRAPLAELNVCGDDQAVPLVAVRHPLEQQPRAVEVQRHVAELVQDDQVVSGDALIAASSECSRAAFWDTFGIQRYIQETGLSHFRR